MQMNCFTSIDHQPSRASAGALQYPMYQQEEEGLFSRGNLHQKGSLKVVFQSCKNSLHFQIISNLFSYNFRVFTVLFSGHRKVLSILKCASCSYLIKMSHGLFLFNFLSYPVELLPFVILTSRISVLSHIIALWGKRDIDSALFLS